MTEDFWNWAKVAKYRQIWSHWLSCSRVNSQRFATFRSHWNKASTNSTYLGGRYSSVVSSAHTIVQTQGSNPKQTIYTIFSSYCWNLSCAYYCKEKRTKINEKEACDWPIFWKSSTHLSFLLLSNLFGRPALVLVFRPVIKSRFDWKLKLRKIVETNTGICIL